MGLTETAQETLAGVEAAILDVCRSHWPAGHGRPEVLAWSPGRLDCIGGMADFSGTLALQMVLPELAYVAVGRREDQRCEVLSVGWNGEKVARAGWPLAQLYESDGQVTASATFRDHFDAVGWVRQVAGVCLTLLSSGHVPHLAGGVTLLVYSEIPASAGLGASAAIQLAAAKALVTLFGVELSDRQLIALCREANIEVAGGVPGLVDYPTCLWGKPGALLQVRCQPEDVLGSLPMPAGVGFAAVDSGVRLPIYSQRYQDNRVAALMGRHLIEQILRASGAVGDPTGGYLANVSPSEYVRRFRNELPVKIRGRDYVSMFGTPAELDGQIIADRLYKVRSRTEHHIYENDRAHRFMERLARARRTGAEDLLIEAGELLYASHWSYGQRCGMGSIETDTLVNLIRERGAAAGLYGAKVTGGGCGGALAVLLKDTPEAFQALGEAASVYQEKVGRPAAVLSGRPVGGGGFGVRVLD